MKKRLRTKIFDLSVKLIIFVIITNGSKMFEKKKVCRCAPIIRLHFRARLRGRELKYKVFKPPLGIAA